MTFWNFMKNICLTLIACCGLGQAKDIVIPLRGIGTLRLAPENLESILISPLSYYKLIDTAKAYGNEDMIGEVLEKLPSHISENVVVITKLFRPNSENTEALRAAILDSIQKLGREGTGRGSPGRVPVFFLIHGPYPDVPMLALLQELETMKQEELVQGCGVSNFDIEHLEFLKEHGFKPELNQVEYHPLFQRQELLAYCNQQNIILQAYRPVIKGVILENATIASIAQTHNVNPVTVVYSWLAQQRIPFVTKVSSPEHQKDFLEYNYITLSQDEMDKIAALNQHEKGRTCTTGGWYLPFTELVKQRWSFH